MTYEELKIQLDIGDPVVVLNSTSSINYYDGIEVCWFAVCDDGDCHLFDKHGNELDISRIKGIKRGMVPVGAKKVVVPDCVDNIGRSVFANYTILESIELPSSIKSIGEYAFYWCASLKSIKIPSNVKSIGKFAFYYCACLESINVPSGVNSIGEWAFAICTGLRELVFTGKTLEQVKAMQYYPWGIEDTSIIKCT